MSEPFALARRAAGRVRRDIRGLRGALLPPPARAAAPAPGLHTYPLDLPGGRGRIHLRVHRDGTGLLARDVTDAVHLNATAAEMVHLALEGVPADAALALLRRRYRGAGAAHLREELAGMYALVERFRSPDTRCPTCALPALERIPAFSAPAGAPYKVDIALTYRCNNRCAHCYNEAGRKAMPSLGTAEWRRVLNKVAEIGIPHVILTGGEPTLLDDLPELIRYADELGPIVGMNTNGRRLADAGFARALAQAGLSHVQVTLNSSRAEVHDAMTGDGGRGTGDESGRGVRDPDPSPVPRPSSPFRETVRGIRNALEAGIHTITNTTLTRRNRDRVEELLDFLHALGIRTFAMNGMIYSGGGAEEPDALPAEEMAPLLARARDAAAERGMRFLWYTPTEYCRLSPLELQLGARRCSAGEYSCCIEPNGDVLPCQSFYAPAGNILRDPWESIWDGPLFRGFRARKSDPKAAGLPERCWECPDLPVCGGGCRIEREAHARKGEC